MKKTLLLIPLLALGVLSACRVEKKDDSSTPGDDESTEYVSSEEHKEGVVVTITYYASYNDVGVKKYYTAQEDSGHLIAHKPADPTSPYPEFSVFKGWSRKEIINDDKDLWDFSKNLVPSSKEVMTLYGIWVAAGE